MRTDRSGDVQKPPLTICPPNPSLPANKPQKRQGWKTGVLMKIRASLTIVVMACLLCAGASLAQAPAGLTEGNPPMSQNLRNALAPPPPLPQLVIPPASNEWLTWGYDQERTGWNRAETTLSPKNVGKLKQLWSTQLAVPADKYVLSTMTAPIVVSGVATSGGPADLVFILGANDTLFAIDANSGKQVWSKTFPNPHKSTAPIRDWLCPKTVNTTPTIDKARGIVFFLTGDGLLRGLNLADGAERLTPTPMTAPFARAWSLNLIDNVLYSPSGRAAAEVTSDKDRASNNSCRHVGPAPRRRRALAGCQRAQCRRCQRSIEACGHAFLHQRRAPGGALGPRRRGARPRRRDAGDQRRPL